MDGNRRTSVEVPESGARSVVKAKRCSKPNGVVQSSFSTSDSLNLIDYDSLSAGEAAEAEKHELLSQTTKQLSPWARFGKNEGEWTGEAEIRTRKKLWH